MGIDSLIAVEIRTWFLKNLEVNMPVLKILGGASIGELLDHAMENLPEIFKTNNSNIGDDTTNHYGWNQLTGLYERFREGV